MDLNQKEQEFLQSIKDKISKYEIKVSVKDAINASSGTFIETTYNNNEKEIVDAGIEKFLCSKSPFYFIKRYCYISVPNMGIIPFDLYYFQEGILKEIEQYKRYVTLKSRQCLTEDNYVMTNRGYISIKDVVPGDKIETLVNKVPTFVDVYDAFPNGKKEVIRILTNFGSELKCTKDHKIYTQRGWVEAGQLTVQDEIVSIFAKGAFGSFELEDDKMASLIGYYLADGKPNQPIFTSTDFNYANEVLEVGNIFENCSPYIKERTKIENRKIAYDVKLSSKSKNPKLDRPVISFLRKFELLTLKKYRKLTNDLLNLNERQMTILLNRLYAGDGWITHKKSQSRPNYIAYEVGIGSSCYALIKQLEYILQTKYGISCYVMEVMDKRVDEKFWKLRITQKKSVIEFVNRIGIKGKTDTDEIRILLEKEEPYNIKQSFEKIRKIENIDGLFDVYDITTQSSDFLSNGLLVHNCGLSTVSSFYCLWRALFRNSESIAIVSKKKDAAQDFISKMKVTLDYLPHFLRQKIISSNMSSIKFGNESEIKSEARSPNAGRSSTLSLLVMDEAAFYGSEDMASSIVASAMPTLTRTGGSILIISTPNGSTGEGKFYFEQVQNLLMTGNTETDKLVEVDWFEVPDMPNIFPQKGYNAVLQKYINLDYYHNPKLRNELKSFFKPIETNWRSNDWLKTQFDVLGEAKFRQEILHDFVTMGNAVFSNDILSKILARTKEPVAKDVLNGESCKGLWIWKAPLASKRYIVCADISTGTSSDFSVAQILDVENYEQVAEFRSHVSTVNFSPLLKKICRYYNNAYLVIESNSIGEAVFNSVYYDEMDPYRNVFKQEKSKNGITRMTGWITNTGTRKLIVNELIDWLTVEELFTQLKLYSTRLHTELCTWIWKENGKAEHGSGKAHDDIIIAFALALYNRNKALSNNAAFIIDENGKMIQPTRAEEGDKDNSFYGIVMDGLDNEGDSYEDKILQEAGVGIDDYRWLLGIK